MASSTKLFKCFLIASIFLQAVSATNQMVIYWGQDSAEGASGQKEKALNTFCQDSSYDIIVVGFVYLFPSASGNADPTMPGMNFANHCEVPFSDANPYVLNCTANIAPDITYCQQRGKKIILSFGGGVGSYGFSSDAQAVTFATTVWNMFLGGSGSVRPFGTAIFDGVDLDIEGGTQTGYIAFIKTLRNYFAASGRTYLITAAPQCFFPDRLGPGTGTPLTEAWFDYIWIQFYNNHCGLDEYPTNFNFAKWAAAMQNLGAGANPNVKLLIGAPASSYAAASGYVSLSTLQTIATAIKSTFPNIYGGIMLWDAANSDYNGNFGTQVASFVHEGGSVTPPSTPSTPATTGAVRPATTGATLPSTTGRTAPSVVTTGSVKPMTTGSVKPVTTGMSSIPTSSTSTSASSQTCESRNMKCLTDTTYSTCSRGVWAGAQSCSVGTVCKQSGDFIYCIPGSPSTPTPTPTPTTPTPTTPSTPSTTGVNKKATTGVALKPSTTGSSTNNDGKCVTGYQECVSDNSYRTCGNQGWAVQNCQVGLSCHPSATANNIYCY